MGWVGSRQFKKSWIGLGWVHLLLGWVGWVNKYGPMSISAVARAYTRGLGLYDQWDPGAKPLVLVGGQGKSPLKLKAISKTKWAILRSEFNYLTFWCFQIFRPLLLICYIVGGKVSVLGLCFGGWIVHVWGAIFVVFGGLSPRLSSRSRSSSACSSRALLEISGRCPSCYRNDSVKALTATTILMPVLQDVLIAQPTVS